MEKSQIYNDLKCIRDYDLNKYIINREKERKLVNRDSWFDTYTKDDLELLLENNSSIYSYYYNNDLIATSILIPDRKLKNTILIRILLKNKYKKLEIAKYIVKDLLNKIKEEQYAYAYTMIHPDNIDTINSFVLNKFILKETLYVKNQLNNLYIKKIEPTFI